MTEQEQQIRIRQEARKKLIPPSRYFKMSDHYRHLIEDVDWLLTELATERERRETAEEIINAIRGVLYDPVVQRYQNPKELVDNIIEMRTRLARLETALKEIDEHPHNSYYYPQYDNSPYSMGNVDGHRCAARIARAALVGGT